MINSDFEAIIRDVRLNLESNKSLEFKEPNDLDFGQRVFWDRLHEKLDDIISASDNGGCCSVCADRVSDEASYAIEFIDEYLREESKAPRPITMLTFMSNDKSCGISAIIYDDNKVDCANKQLKKELCAFIESNRLTGDMKILVGRSFADFECMDCTVSWYFEAEYKEQLRYRGMTGFIKLKWFNWL